MLDLGAQSPKLGKSIVESMGLNPNSLVECPFFIDILRGKSKQTLGMIAKEVKLQL